MFYIRFTTKEYKEIKTKLEEQEIEVEYEDVSEILVPYFYFEEYPIDVFMILTKTIRQNKKKYHLNVAIYRNNNRLFDHLNIHTITFRERELPNTDYVDIDSLIEAVINLVDSERTERFQDRLYNYLSREKSKKTVKTTEERNKYKRVIKTKIEEQMGDPKKLIDSIRYDTIFTDYGSFKLVPESDIYGVNLINQSFISDLNTTNLVLNAYERKEAGRYILKKNYDGITIVAGPI